MSSVPTLSYAKNDVPQTPSNFGLVLCCKTEINIVS